MLGLLLLAGSENSANAVQLRGVNMSEETQQSIDDSLDSLMEKYDKPEEKKTLTQKSATPGDKGKAAPAGSQPSQS